MSEETATVEYSADAKAMGDKIAALTLVQAKELSDYLENEHGIKAAAGTGASLMDAKKMVEGCPATLKEAASKEDCDKIKADVEAAGGSVELK